MKKKLNFWIINFFLTAVTSFLLNGGVFAGNTEDISLSKGRIGSIKLSGKHPTAHVKGNSPIVRYPFRKQLRQGIRTCAHQEE